MSITRNIGMILLSVYLILVGLSLVIAGFVIPPVILGILAIAAGVFILIGR